MATGKALDGKPYAGKPHVLFGERDVASVTPRRGSLLYNIICVFVVATFSLLCFCVHGQILWFDWVNIAILSILMSEKARTFDYSWFLLCILPCASGFTIAFLLNLSWLYLAVVLVACPIVMFLTLGFLARINLISPFWCGSMGMEYLIMMLIMCDIGIVAAVILNRIFLGG
jgi:hypothetical protein